MGTMTRLEMQTEIIANLDNRQDIADATIQRWINHTLHHMTHPGVHIFEDLSVTYNLVLISGIGEYDISSSVLGYRVLGIRAVTYFHAPSSSIATNTRRRLLNPKPIQWYDNRTHAPGEPQNYTIGEGQTILFSLTPNNYNTVRIRLSREAASLSSDSSTTTLPEYFDEVLVTGTQAFAEFKLGMRDRANETFQLFSALLNGGTEKNIIEAQAWNYMTPLTQVPSMGVS